MQNVVEANNPHNSQSIMPLLMWKLMPGKIDDKLYGNGDGYSDDSQTIDEGIYFMGSPKKNTRCNKFTILGADKTHQDDTKEK